MLKTSVVPRIKALLSDQGLSLSMFAIAVLLLLGVLGGLDRIDLVRLFYASSIVAIPLFISFGICAWIERNLALKQAPKRVGQGHSELTPQEVRAELEVVLKKTRQSRRKIEAEEAKIEARLAQLEQIEGSV